MASFKSKLSLKHWQELRPWPCQPRASPAPYNKPWVPVASGVSIPPEGAGVTQPGAAVSCVMVTAHVSEVSQESSNFLSSSINQLCRCSPWPLADVTHEGTGIREEKQLEKKLLWDLVAYGEWHGSV